MDATSCAVMVPIVNSIVKHLEDDSENESHISDNKIESSNDGVILNDPFETHLSTSDGSCFSLSMK